MKSLGLKPCLLALLSHIGSSVAQDFGTMGTDMGRGGDMQNEEDMNEVLDVNMLMDGEHMSGESLAMGTDGRLRPVNRANLRTQTLLALQELGVVVGVAIMVAAIFLLMIAVEKIIDSIVLRYRLRFGKPVADLEAEDPAALLAMIAMLVLMLLPSVLGVSGQDNLDVLETMAVNVDGGLIDPGVLGAIEEEQSNDGDQQHIFTYNQIGNFGTDVPLSIQSLRALQELGVVLAVAFMVALIFLLLMAAEQLATAAKVFVDKLLGRKGPIDEVEDPAALVGTFKRYKN